MIFGAKLLTMIYRLVFVCNFVRSSDSSAFTVDPNAICNKHGTLPGIKIQLMAHMEGARTAELMVTRLWGWVATNTYWRGGCMGPHNWCGHSSEGEKNLYLC